MFYKMWLESIELILFETSIWTNCVCLLLTKMYNSKLLLILRVLIPIKTLTLKYVNGDSRKFYLMKNGKQHRDIGISYNLQNIILCFYIWFKKFILTVHEIVVKKIDKILFRFLVLKPKT